MGCLSHWARTSIGGRSDQASVAETKRRLSAERGVMPAGEAQPDSVPSSSKAELRRRPLLQTGGFTDSFGKPGQLAALGAGL